MHLLKIVFAVFLFTTLSFAQQDALVVHYDESKLEKHDISEDDLSSYKENPEFNYTEVETEESIFSRIKRWLANILTKIFEAIFGVGKAGGILYFIFNILPYLLLAFLIFLLIKFFLKVNSKSIISGQQNPGTVQFTEDEQIIKNEDINKLINDAIKQKNFRLAIRYYYLQSLKFLAEKQHINWEQQKTNVDYISEIKKDTIKTGFKTITRIYDYVWYGEFSIDELKFETLKSSFETLNTTIKTQ
ncbi:DUF4129 domain-containing protein [Ichthyenterobacterium magnum]|uniref:DUF4129 domain-containing protein n=1 Tax=Ichthyenterobacterium magnum TaxID=1230530 RepID=A0A420DGP0_9FLAO|nr:DUF4129 domain-containing protein [Ichthyenterobacterium magnum]RKE92246.1 hypothetical protein BXY80_2164 [Ichthyenterobacterium magnum]